MNFTKTVLRRYPDRVALLFLFCTTLFIRLPFFFRDYTDTDESTFILMGQSIADGHLPYVHLWDLKPPLLFYIYGAIEAIVPHSFIAIRFFGVLVVFFSAFFLLKIAKKADLQNGFLIALLYIIFSSELGNLQGLMSEHLAVFFLLPGLLCLQKKEAGFYFLAGVLFGCSFLCKINYAYAVAALLISLLLFNRNKSSFSHVIQSNLLIGFGIALPFLLIALPFYIEKKSDVFINSVFLAPIEYGNAQQYSFIEKLERTWWVILAALLLSMPAIKKITAKNKELTISSIAVLSGTIYTFFSSGIVNGHYLIQIFPFVLLLLVGSVIQKKWHVRFRWLVLFVILISVESLVEYYRLFKSYSNNSTFYYRTSFQIVNELKKKQLDKKKIFFIDYHIGYWLLHQNPLTKSTTHPTNLGRPFLFKYFDDYNTPLQELKYLMEEVRPDVVVSHEVQFGFFLPDGEENIYFRTVIGKDFKLIKQDSDKEFFIWQRIER